MWVWVMGVGVGVGVVMGGGNIVSMREMLHAACCVCLCTQGFTEDETESTRTEG